MTLAFSISVFANAAGQIQQSSILGQQNSCGICVFMNERLRFTLSQTVQNVLH